MLTFFFTISPFQLYIPTIVWALAEHEKGGPCHEACSLVTCILLGQIKREKGLGQCGGAFEELLPAGVFLPCVVQPASAFSACEGCSQSLGARAHLRSPRCGRAFPMQGEDVLSPHKSWLPALKVHLHLSFEGKSQQLCSANDGGLLNSPLQ